MRRRVIALALALVALVSTAWLASSDLLARVSRIEIVLSSESGGKVELLFPRHRIAADPARNPKKVTSFEAGARQTIRLKLPQPMAPVFQFRFISAGEVELHGLTFRSAYAPPVVVDSQFIAAEFLPATEHTSAEYRDGGVLLSSENGAMELSARARIQFHRPLLSIGLPLLISTIVFLLSLRLDPARIPSLAQLRPAPGVRPHSFELDGLRGIAAISVVADHTWGIFTGSGLVGVWVFFALSGYLLSGPFVRRPDIIFQPRQIERFYFRRLARILPMYYTILFIYYVGSGKVHMAIPHFLFFRGDGHFWTIPQEMFFYLILPAVMLVMAGLLRIRFAVAFAVLVASTVWLLWNDTSIDILLFSLPRSHNAYMGWFLIGICVSYLVNSPVSRLWLASTQSRFAAPVGWIALLVLMTVFVSGSVTLASGWFGRTMNLAHQYRPLFGIAAGFLVFAAVYARDTIYGAVLRIGLLRSFGILGFSVYLIHPLLLDVLMRFSTYYFDYTLLGVRLFVATMLASWVVGTFTYNLIEYPFLLKRSKPDNR